METQWIANTWRVAGRVACVGMVAVALGACGTGVTVPAAQPDTASEQRDLRAFVEAMKPRRDGKPVVAVVALNEGTEITDFLLPYAVLRRAGVADVHAVAPRAGRVALYPALEIENAQDLAGFDRANPGGADYVIVPAMRNDDDPAVTNWLRAQAAKGARIIGICAGGLVVGQAGLLDGRRFTTHWYYRKTLAGRHASAGATYVPHRRYVFDRDIATTTGITASVPTMLALVEAIGGHEKAQRVAAELGVADWTAAHDSTRFGLDAGRAWSYLINQAAFWRDERWSVGVQDGTDDVALALAADAWTRTGHVEIEAVSASGSVTLRSGLRIVARPAAVNTVHVLLAPELKPVRQLDRTLCEIGARFGVARRDWVMQEIEYPGPAVCAG